MPNRRPIQVAAQPFSVPALRLTRAANQTAGPRSMRADRGGAQSRASTGRSLANQKRGGFEHTTESRTANHKAKRAHSVSRAGQSGASLGGVLKFGGSFGLAGTCAEWRLPRYPKPGRGWRELGSRQNAPSDGEAASARWGLSRPTFSYEYTEAKDPFTHRRHKADNTCVKSVWGGGGNLSRTTVGALNVLQNGSLTEVEKDSFLLSLN